MLLSLILSSFFTFVELNCENLFDTVHDSLKNDVEFLPESDYHWTRTRYWRKINHISQEILALGEVGMESMPSAGNPEATPYYIYREEEKQKRTEGDKDRQVKDWHLPDFVALCEVENDSVMIALTKRSLLRKAGYEYVMTSSPDDRGIDVALMYQPTSFRLLSHYPIRIKRLPDTRPTRDILYAKGMLINDDTLHVFVVHAPSRRGGEQASRPYRLQVASQLAHSVDSLYMLNDSAKIIVAGDFNDYHDSPALKYLEKHHLVNISKEAKGRNGAKATYRYHGEWGSLDQMLCSPSLSRRKQFCEIGDMTFLLQDDEKYGGKKPYRTYLGPRYLGGYSDHLPLVGSFKM